MTDGPSDKLFSTFPDPMQADIVPFNTDARCGLIVKWAAQDIGFGDITFVIDKQTGNVTLDTETMGMEFVGKALMALKDRGHLEQENELLARAIKVQANAARVLGLKERAEYLATQSLESEREMNAKLTAEVEEWQARYEALLELTSAGGTPKGDWQGKL